jgi:hypothetical protein
VEEVLALQKEEGDAVLVVVVEERWKGSWAPSLSTFTALDSFMGRGRMGGGEEVGESYTEGDVFTEEDWGPPIDNSGEKKRDKGGDKEGDVRRRSKQDSNITPRMAAFMGKENRGSKAKAAATTRHDGWGGRKWGRVIWREMYLPPQAPPIQVPTPMRAVSLMFSVRGNLSMITSGNHLIKQILSRVKTCCHRRQVVVPQGFEHPCMQCVSWRCVV